MLIDDRWKKMTQATSETVFQESLKHKEDTFKLWRGSLSMLHKNRMWKTEFSSLVILKTELYCGYTFYWYLAVFYSMHKKGLQHENKVEWY